MGIPLSIEDLYLFLLVVKNLPANARNERFLGREDPLEEEMTTHSSTLTWRIPGTEGPDGLQSCGYKELNVTG